MVVRFVARVYMDNMASKTLYPMEETSEERVALLTGIIQLVSAALQHDDEKRMENVHNYMKSDRGVVGYFEREGSLYICEADTEKETETVLDLIQKNIDCENYEISQKIANVYRKRGREISSLWG